MNHYRWTGETKSNGRFETIEFVAETDDEAWEHVLPADFHPHAVQRQDGEQWIDLEVTEEEAFGTLGDIISRISSAART